jgi:hypothetical protein
MAALGTEAERQNSMRVEVRAAWEVKGWLVDGIAQLWARVIEEGLRGGDGSSPEMRGGHAGCLSTWRSKGRTARGKAAPGGRAKRRVERVSRRWRRRTVAEPT